MTMNAVSSRSLRPATRWLIPVLVVLSLLSACSTERGGLEEFVGRADGFAGEEMSLQEARERAAFEITLPLRHPSAEVRAAHVAGRDPEVVQVAVEYDDGSFIEFLPKDVAPNYETHVALSGQGSVRRVAGVSMYALEPTGDARGLLRWYLDGIEYIIVGRMPLRDMIEMAESMLSH